MVWLAARGSNCTDLCLQASRRTLNQADASVCTNLGMQLTTSLRFRSTKRTHSSLAFRTARNSSSASAPLHAPSPPAHFLLRV